MTQLKQHVGNLIERVKAMTKIRTRLGADRMTDAQLIELADELRAARFTPEAIQFLTGLVIKEEYSGKITT